MLIDRFRLDDRVAIVTAAGRGIGAASALAFAEAGADVVISARTESQLDGGRGARWPRSGAGPWSCPPTSSDVDAVEGLVDLAVAEFGRLDIVVNNVGGTMPMPFLDTTVETFEQAFHFNVAHRVRARPAPRCRRCSTGDGGSVVNITSAMGRFRDRGLRRLRHRQGRARAHDPPARAPTARRKVRVNGGRAGFDRHVGARDRAHQRADAPRDGREDAAAPARRRRRHRARGPLPRVRRRRATSPARSSRSTAASRPPTSTCTSRPVLSTDSS